MSPVTHQMLLIASTFVLGEFILAMSASRGRPFLATLVERAPRFVVAALFGAAVGYVLFVFGIKVTP